jgi:MFS family permease
LSADAKRARAPAGLWRWLTNPWIDLKTRHPALSILVVLLNGLSCGVFTGFAGLALMMQREGQYCGTPMATCDEQVLQFTLIFNLGFVGQSLVAPLSGVVLDFVGPRAVGFCGVALYFAGLLLFAFSDQTGAAGVLQLNAFGAGFFFWGAASSPIQTPLFQLANMFRRRSQVSALIVSMFIASTLVFPILNMIHRALWPRVSMRTLLLILLVQPIAVTLISLVFLPRKSIPASFVADRDHALADRSAGRRVVSERVVEVRPNGDKVVRRRLRRRRARRRAAQRPPKLTRSEPSRALPVARLVRLGTFRRQLFSVEALVGLVYFSLNFLPFNWYIASFREQLAARGDEGTLTSAFQFFVPAGALASPVIGLLLDRFGIFPASVFTSINVVVIAITTMIPSLHVQWVTFAVLAFGRPLHMATFFAYFGKFGFKHYGKLVGIGNLCFGVANQLQFALLALVVPSAANAAVKDFVNAHILLLVLASVLAVAFCTLTFRRFRN